MNEMLVTGYFYMKTCTTTNEDALAAFLKACEGTGIEAGDITSIVVRDKDGEDLTERIENPFY